MITMVGSSLFGHPLMRVAFRLGFARMTRMLAVVEASRQRVRDSGMQEAESKNDNPKRSHGNEMTSNVGATDFQDSRRD